MRILHFNFLVNLVILVNLVNLVILENLVIRMNLAYSYTDPNCRDSPLELDNSRLSLDEYCLIRVEN